MIDGIHQATVQFLDWWENKGRRVVAPFYHPLGIETLKNLCEVAYYQGRMDESTKQTQQLTEQLARVSDGFTEHRYKTFSEMAAEKIFYKLD